MKASTFCTCCKAEVTAPVFINHKPYGYACAGKIGYTGKKGKKLNPPVSVVRWFAPINSSRGLLVLDNGVKIAAYGMDSDSIQVAGYFDQVNHLFYPS